MLDDEGTPIIIDVDGSGVVGGFTRKTVSSSGTAYVPRLHSTPTIIRFLSLVAGSVENMTQKSQPIENPSEDPILERILENHDLQPDSRAPTSPSTGV